MRFPVKAKETYSMPYLETYSAFARFHGDKAAKQWHGLSKGQAKWRYHWIKRQWYGNPEFQGIKEFGWERDWQA